MIGFRAETDAPEVAPPTPAVVSDVAPKRKRKAKGDPCSACQGTGIAEPQQKIGFDVADHPQLAPGPLPIPNPLPRPAVRAIALHRILETVSPADCARPIWLALHESARDALTGLDAEVYRRYHELREQAIYGESHFGRGHKEDVDGNTRVMKAAQDALVALLRGMPAGDDGLRLEVALYGEAVTVARTELVRSERFLLMMRGLLEART